nr:reverse transcriptase domain-containing protein [Tanacetum cinerariifolium]
PQIHPTIHKPMVRLKWPTKKFSMASRNEWKNKRLAGWMSYQAYYGHIEQRQRKAQKKCVLLSGILYTGPFFIILSLLNTISISMGATTALPFGTIVVILLAYSLIAIPLLAFGGLMGFRFRSKFQAPSATKISAREIPMLAWYRKTPGQMLISGLLPFSAVVLELHNLYATIWSYKILTLPANGRRSSMVVEIEVVVAGLKALIAACLVEIIDMVIQDIDEAFYLLFKEGTYLGITYKPIKTMLNCIGRVIAIALMRKMQVGVVFGRAFFLQLAGINVSLEDIAAASRYWIWRCTHIHVLGDGAQMLGFPCLNGKDYEKMGRIYRDGDALHILHDEMGKGMSILYQLVFAYDADNSANITFVLRPTENVVSWRDIASNEEIKKLFYKSFELEDLDGMLHGSESAISIDDWKAHTEYDGYKETDPQICWFWEAKAIRIGLAYSVYLIRQKLSTRVKTTTLTCSGTRFNPLTAHRPSPILTMSINEQTPLSQSTSAVRNTLGKEQAPQDFARPISDKVLREYCDKNYHKILPIIAEKVHQEKLKAVKSRRNFKETSRHSGTGTPSRKRSLKERLGHRHAQSTSGSLVPRLGDREKDVSAHSRDSRHRLYHCNRGYIESRYQSSRSRETKIGSVTKRNPREERKHCLKVKAAREDIRIQNQRSRSRALRTTCTNHGTTSGGKNASKTRLKSTTSSREMGNPQNNSCGGEKLWPLIMNEGIRFRHGNSKKPDKGKTSKREASGTNKGRSGSKTNSPSSQRHQKNHGSGQGEVQASSAHDDPGNAQGRKAVTSNQGAEAKQWKRLGKGSQKGETFGKDKPLPILMLENVCGFQRLKQSMPQRRLSVPRNRLEGRVPLATYQRLVDKAFQKQIGQNLDVYVDDLVIKSHTKKEVIRDTEETFKTLREINMIKSQKCAFGMREGTLLGYKVDAEGLRVCPDKRCTKKSDFQWTTEAEAAFKQMKQLIAELPMLTAPKEKEELIMYLETTNEAISAVLITERDGKQIPIYFVNRVLQGPEVNYTPMEKLILALRFELEEHDIHYIPRTSIKGQILTDFIVEHPEEETLDTTMKDRKELSDPWILFTDGSSCIDGSRAGIIITNLEGKEFTYALRFKFNTTNNEAEYEALIAGLRIARKMEVQNLQANMDSKLVANQVNGVYVAKDSSMIKYLDKVKNRASTFKEFSIKQVPRGENKKADTLSKMVSTSFAHLSKQVLVEELKEKSIDEKEVLAVVEEEGRTWLTPIYEYLIEEILLKEKRKARAIRRKARRDNPFKDWCEKLCICQGFASVKHPQANGLVKRANRSLVIPVEIGMPTLRTAEVDMIKNDEALEINLDLLEERREHTSNQEAKSKAKMEKYYNTKVRSTSFRPSDLVYRSNEASHAEDEGKLGPKWE